MSTFRLAEHFISINGEGQRAGELALFLRFTVCNLRCDWCDTMWANEKNSPFTAVTLKQLLDIAEEAMSDGVKNVTLTGGEPLLQEGVGELIDELMRLGMRVEIETNGSISIVPFINERRPVITMDYKLPSSKMEKSMCLENLRLLGPEDTLKFVCGSHEDLERAAEIIEIYHPKSRIYLSPVFGRIEPCEIVDFMKEHKLGEVRLQLQLHKFIWPPDARGV